MKLIIAALLLTVTMHGKVITICDDDGCRNIIIFGDDK